MAREASSVSKRRLQQGAQDVDALVRAISEAWMPRSCNCPQGMRYHAINCPHRPNALNERAALDALVALIPKTAWDDPEVWAQKLSECQEEVKELRSQFND